MDTQVLELLVGTQSPVDDIRKGAENQLEQLYTNGNEAFPLSLASIAHHVSVPTNLRQSALLVLKTFVLRAWSPSLDEFAGKVLISDANKEELRQTLLSIATTGHEDRKVVAAASYVVSKIASADFPEAWPALLSTLLDLVPRTTDDQLHGVLTVLSDLVEDGFDEDQFSESARDLIKCLYDVAVDGGKKLTLRALSVSIFRACFDTMELVYQNNKASVKQFMQEASDAWSPFFIDVLKTPLPAMPSEDEEAQGGPAVVHWRGLVALKIQVVKALDKIQSMFPQLLASHAIHLFSTIWEASQAHLEPYQLLYINEDRQGRLEDADRLPYTLDFLILEELDYMMALLSAIPVKKELEAQVAPESTSNGSQNGSWISQVMGILVGYAQITTEEEGLWEIDVNIFLSEETSETANYSPRNACSDLVTRLCGWASLPTVESLLSFTKVVFEDGASTWRSKEAALFILNQVLVDFDSEDKAVNADIASAFTEYVQNSMQDNNLFLRARGFIVAGALTTASGDTLKDIAPSFAQGSLGAINDDSSDLVKVSCIRVLQDYIKMLPSSRTRDFQVQTVAAMSAYLSTQDLSDLTENEDILDTLVETLRDVIMADPTLCLDHPALDILFTMASYGASNFQTTMLVNETFESITSSLASNGAETYSRLCAKVLPTLTAALDVGDITGQNALSDMAVSLLCSLAEHGLSPLPQGFVGSVMPKLYRLLFSNVEFSLHQTATSTIKHMLVHDPDQIFAWHDPDTGKGGLEVILLVIDRLLGPEVDDSSAAEVGGLAVELVEKAGSERLGPYLMQLLRVVAIRLSTAEHANFIQNLVLVFARLSLTNAQEVIDFLAEVHVEGTGDGTGLEVVLKKWLENSVNFSGYDDIRQNVIALVAIYNLHDERLNSIQVQGDLIVQNTSRIKTRSRAKIEPDQYAMIPVPVKLIKVLIQELANTLTPIRPTHKFGNDDEDSEENDEWEDEPGVLDLGASTTRTALMSYMDETQWDRRQLDDETQAFLADFFRHMANEPSFQAVYMSLNDVEKEKLGRIWNTTSDRVCQS